MDITGLATGMKVCVTLSYRNFQSVAFRASALAAFGEGIKPFFTCIRDLDIICRPDQFAIFMFERNRLGGCNSFKDLDMKLIDPPAHLQPLLDVTNANL